MTGAGGLSSSFQPVTEKPSTLSLSVGVAGSPRWKGSAETLARAQGKAFPSRGFNRKLLESYTHQALRETENLLNREGAAIEGILSDYRDYLMERIERVTAFRARNFAAGAG